VAEPPSSKATFVVVVNSEEQYSIWPIGSDIPGGWSPADFQGSEDECLDHIDRVWTDLRPLSLRRALGELSQPSE
jgi:MbtH protein